MSWFPILTLVTLCQAIGSSFRDDLGGISAVFPEDGAYRSAATPFNLRFSWKPVAITFPKDAFEVSEVVKLGVLEGLNVVARSGGHSYIANGLGGKDGALVIDLRNMTKIDLDTSRNTASVETGSKVGSIAVALDGVGRALPHGVCPDVGIGGHASFGGFGPTSRMWGMTLDRIKSLNVVLANGTLVKTSAEEYPDLFWAMRGAGASFGVTTSIEFATLPAPSQSIVVLYRWNMTVPEATDAIEALQSFVQTDIPAHLGVELFFGPGPEEGEVDLGFLLGWYAEGGFEDARAPLFKQLPQPSQVKVWNGTYLNSVLVNGQLEQSPSLTNTSLDPVAMYDKSLMTPESAPPSRKAIEAYINHIAYAGHKLSDTLRTQCTWELYGGGNSAVNSISPSLNAFAHRNKMFTIACIAGNTKGATFPDAGFQYLDDLMDTLVSNMPSDWDYGAYANYIDDRLPDWEHRYYGQHYVKLQSIKKQYDPGNTFSFPLSVRV